MPILRATGGTWNHEPGVHGHADHERSAAMNIREVPLDDLVLDPNLNLRDRLDDFTVERYADSWERLPPITVFEVEDHVLIADGFHRHAAAVMMGKRTISAEIRTGTFTEA